MSPTVTTSRDGDVATVTIDRPERRNALDSSTASALRDALQSAGGEARAVILTGAGGAFCAGGDLAELEQWSAASPEAVRRSLYDSFQGIVRAIRAADAIVIAAIDGPAVGAGLDVALACDLRVASKRAKLGQVWVRLGLIPGTGGAWLTQALAGPGRAAELLLTGDVISAEEAHAADLVNRVVPTEALLSETQLLAERILRNPRGGVIANKRALVEATAERVEAALEHAARVQPERFTSSDFRTAVKAARGAAGPS